MNGEPVKLNVREEFILEKFDGDAPKEGEHKEPVERIRMVFENGELVSREFLIGENTDGTK